MESDIKAKNDSLSDNGNLRFNSWLSRPNTLSLALNLIMVKKQKTDPPY